MVWLGLIVFFVGDVVLSRGGDAVGDVVCVDGAGFHPRLWRLCAIYNGMGLRGWRVIVRDRGMMSG